MLAAWAFAKLGIADIALFQKLAKEVERNHHSLQPLHIANLCWSFATLGIEQDDFLAIISRLSINMITQFNPQQLTNLAWTFARFEMRDVLLFSAIQNQTSCTLAEFVPEGLSKIVWSLAKINYCHDSFLDAVLIQAHRLVDIFDGQSLSTLLWAMAQLNYPGTVPLDPLINRIAALAKTFSSQSLANIIWSLAILQPDSPIDWSDLLSLANTRIDELSDEGITQIYHATFLVPGIQLDTNLRCRCDRVFEQRKKHKPQSNSFEEMIARQFDRLNINYETQFFFEGYFIDIKINFNNRKYALECDGTRFHYVNEGTDSRRFGHDVLKEKILTKSGFTVIRISDKDYINIKQPAKWFRNLLSKHDHSM